LDALIESQTGKSPRTLYLEGESVFRAAEAAALKSLLAKTKCQTVVAGGGGIIDNPDAVQALIAAEAFIAYLHVTAGTAWERIASGPLPSFLVNGKDDPKELHRRLHERRAQACREFAGKKGIVVQCEDKTPQMIAREIAAFIRSEV
jgi:shikimate kinase